MKTSRASHPPLFLLLPELTLLAVASLACSSAASVVRLLDRRRRALVREAW